MALGMFHVLRQRGNSDFDCLIPILLSPEKIKLREIHRTRLLAQELGRLLKLSGQRAANVGRVRLKAKDVVVGVWTR